MSQNSAIVKVYSLRVRLGVPSKDMDQDVVGVHVSMFMNKARHIDVLEFGYCQRLQS